MRNYFNYNASLRISREGKVDSFSFGVAAASVGKTDEAFRYFDLALEEHNSGFIFWSPFNRGPEKWRVSIQIDPRYQKIMDKLAFPKK